MKPGDLVTARVLHHEHSISVWTMPDINKSGVLAYLSGAQTALVVGAHYHGSVILWLQLLLPDGRLGWVLDTVVRPAGGFR